jgi:hypothetical protein
MKFAQTEESASLSRNTISLPVSKKLNTSSGFTGNQIHMSKSARYQARNTMLRYMQSPCEMQHKKRRGNQ